jgi:hypothetical protein
MKNPSVEIEARQRLRPAEGVGEERVLAGEVGTESRH